MTLQLGKYLPVPDSKLLIAISNVNNSYCSYFQLNCSLCLFSTRSGTLLNLHLQIIPTLIGILGSQFNTSFTSLLNNDVVIFHRVHKQNLYVLLDQMSDSSLLKSWADRKACVSVQVVMRDWDKSCIVNWDFSALLVLAFRNKYVCQQVFACYVMNRAVVV